MAARQCDQCDPSVTFRASDWPYCGPGGWSVHHFTAEGLAFLAATMASHSLHPIARPG